MYTIRRTATILAVTFGLATASAGLASAADGTSTGSAPTATAGAASAAASGSTSSAAGSVSYATGSAGEGEQAQSQSGAAAASTQVPGSAVERSAPDAAEEDTDADSPWCTTYRLAVVAVGKTWFGSVHVNGICDQSRS